VEDVFAERREHGLHARERRIIGTHHGVQASFLRFLRRARERRIDECRALGAKASRQRAVVPGSDVEVVDDDEILARAAEQAVAPNTISSTWGEPVTQRITKSAFPRPRRSSRIRARRPRGCPRAASGRGSP
jgi:hypothetical protein